MPGARLRIDWRAVIRGSKGVILLHGLLLALRYRARRISLTLLVAYVSIFCMLSLAHTCESATPRHGEGTPAHAHRITAPGSGAEPAHDCLACTWQRDTTSTVARVSPRYAALRICFKAPVPTDVPLLARALLLLPSRGPPSL